MTEDLARGAAVGGGPAADGGSVADGGPAADELAIAGVVPLSMCDWPDRLVATVFTQGCPWRCVYCHNPELLDPRAPGQVAWSVVRELLGRRVGRLDGVVFSGGEATRQAALAPAMREVRALGFGVGLHTGGAYPRALERVLPLVDWVGLDIKATRQRYTAVTGVPAAGAAAFESLRLVLEAGVAVQVRTTVDPTVLAPADVDELCGLLAGMGVRDHVLQPVRATGVRPEHAVALAEHGITA